MTAPTDRQAAEDYDISEEANHECSHDALSCAICAHLAGQAHGRAAGVMEGMELATWIICYACSVGNPLDSKLVHTGQFAASRCEAKNIHRELARLRKEGANEARRKR